MQIKTLLTQHISPITLENFQSMKVQFVGEAVWKQTLSYIAGKHEKWHKSYGRELGNV